MLATRAAALQRPGSLRPAQARPLRRPVRCFQDGDSSGSQQGKATVRFCIPQQTRFGEQVAVVGSFTGWDTQAPVQLEWGEGSVWSGEAQLPVGERLEYKYVVVSERSGQVTWQPGGNLVLELGPGGGQTVLVLDDWLGRTHEVRPAAAPAAEPKAAAEPEPEMAETAAAQLGQPEVLELPPAAAAEQPSKAAGLELPQEAAAEAGDGVQAVAAPAELAVVPEPELAAKEAAHAPAELAAEQRPVSDSPEQEPAAAAADVPAPAAPHPTAADSWRSALDTANQPYVAPQAVEAAAPASGNGAAAAATAAEDEPAEAAAVLVASDAPSNGIAGAQEPAAAVEESGAAASWRSLLQVANQPYVPPQPLAAVADAEQPQQEVPAPAAEDDGHGAAAAAAAAKAAVAPGAIEAAAEPTAQPASNGSQPAAAHAKPSPAPAAPAVPEAVPVQAPAFTSSTSQQGGRPGMAPWLRLLLAAAVVVSAIIAFLKSPWAAARCALSAL